MKEKTIFTIHGMSDINWKKPRTKDYLGLYRTYGWFSELKDAKNVVEENRGDMYECAYRYIVIEEMEEGIWANVKKDREWWYKWNRSRKKYFPIKKPKELYHIINFGMG